MADVRGVCTSAAQELGIIAVTETLSQEDLAYIVGVLNRRIDTWNSEGLMTYATTKTTWSITASDGEYTVGGSADINVVRPSKIVHVSYTITSEDPDREVPLGEFTDEEYQNLTFKALTAAYPLRWHYNPTMTTGTLNLWPVPTTSGLTGNMYAPTSLTQYSASLPTVTVLQPPGYGEMYVTNLAIAIAAAYNKTPSPQLVDAAHKSLAAVKRRNIRRRDMTFEAASLFGGTAGQYDINSDTFVR